MGVGWRADYHHNYQHFEKGHFLSENVTEKEYKMIQRHSWWFPPGTGLERETWEIGRKSAPQLPLERQKRERDLRLRTISVTLSLKTSENKNIQPWIVNLLFWLNFISKGKFSRTWSWKRLGAEPSNPAYPPSSSLRGRHHVEWHFRGHSIHCPNMAIKEHARTLSFSLDPYQQLNLRSPWLRLAFLASGGSSRISGSLKASLAE